jgi:hypothetical protein
MRASYVYTQPRPVMLHPDPNIFPVFQASNDMIGKISVEGASLKGNGLM